MRLLKATAEACANIAFIKYWGNRDHERRLPANSSLSMNLAALRTRTTVEFRRDLESDTVQVDGRELGGKALDRVVSHLDRIRSLHGTLREKALVVSENSFPADAGLASSASGFAALTVAAAAAAGLGLRTDELSRLSRYGSGSACRSVPGGFVAWDAHDEDDRSFGRTVAPVGHWDLRDVIAIVDPAAKEVGSTEGHRLADSNPFQKARLEGSTGRYRAAVSALLARDWDRLAAVIEEDALALHAVMMTSRPSLLYWQPGTLAVMRAVRGWKAQGLQVAFTIDAGPNVHCICTAAAARKIEAMLASVPGVMHILSSGVGGPAVVLSSSWAGG